MLFLAGNIVPDKGVLHGRASNLMGVVVIKEDFESVGPNQGLSRNFLAVHGRYVIGVRT